MPSSTVIPEVDADCEPDQFVPMDATTRNQKVPVVRLGLVHESVDTLATVVKPLVEDVVDSRTLYPVARVTALQLTTALGLSSVPAHAAETPPGVPGRLRDCASPPDEPRATVHGVAAPAPPCGSSAPAPTRTAHSSDAATSRLVMAQAETPAQLVQLSEAGLLVTDAAPPVAVMPVNDGIEK